MIFRLRYALLVLPLFGLIAMGGLGFAADESSEDGAEMKETAPTFTPRVFEWSPSALLAPMTEEQVEIFPFTPPLSVMDTVDLLRQIRRQLSVAEEESPPSDLRMAQISSALREATSWLRDEDRRLAPLDKYQWRSIGEIKVAPGEPSDVSFLIDPSIGQVSVLTFRAENGRVLVEEIQLRERGVDEKQTHRPELYLQRDVPKREVFYPPKPLELDSIELRLATDAVNKANVHVYAGTPLMEEYGKNALYHLRAAAQKIDEFELEAARDLLRDAERELLKFKEYHGI